ncbi:hypothetical protein ACHHZ9_10920 [Enterobacter cloacae complex sp. 2024EL-00232]|uniref:hypothetical protein n=1 Tax=Enterobacter TaxID=547 RepID=UPI000907CDEB|nr:hypothetical protein [Enterobacter cloacae complex sp. 2021EL-01261]MCD2458461.1 hypothetical protein [Enterobacter cloacae complex sp. 2021EL-01261]HDT2076214.1 hypothetical protein [Enterobacter roggenkampii]HDT2097015.1 hypothetical protein [Enterobacter roggenkampii]HEG2003023.1 hypothetical protein [Enterobacter asburiae]
MDEIRRVFWGIDSWLCAFIRGGKNQRRVIKKSYNAMQDAAWRMLEKKIQGTKRGHSQFPQQKSHSLEWLNYMILKLKFGGPCWT